MPSKPKPPAKNKIPPVAAAATCSAFAVRSIVRSTFENALGNTIAKALDEGWEILSPPTFAYIGQPDGLNGYAVGFHHPHFMVLLVKKPNDQALPQGGAKKGNDEH